MDGSWPHPLLARMASGRGVNVTIHTSHISQIQPVTSGAGRTAGRVPNQRPDRTGQPRGQDEMSESMVSCPCGWP